MPSPGITAILIGTELNPLTVGGRAAGNSGRLRGAATCAARPSPTRGTAAIARLISRSPPGSAVTGARRRIERPGRSAREILDRFLRPEYLTSDRARWFLANRDRG